MCNGIGSYEKLKTEDTRKELISDVIFPRALLPLAYIGIVNLVYNHIQESGDSHRRVQDKCLIISQPLGFAKACFQ
jgi:hypothetical protein